jgi:hypothetical protein
MPFLTLEGLGGKIQAQWFPVKILNLITSQRYVLKLEIEPCNRKESSHVKKILFRAFRGNHYTLPMYRYSEPLY